MKNIIKLIYWKYWIKLMNSLKDYRNKNCKLGVTYSVFDGEELLRNSILSIRENVDYVNVVWQRFSWFGDKCNPEIENLLNDLVNEGLVDKVIEYPFSNFPTKNYKYELKKRNMGIKDLRKNHCTHCMIMDTDEFYFSDEFKRAKSFVIGNNITHSACIVYNYGQFPEIRKRDPIQTLVPFIFKLRWYSHLSAHHNMPCLVDPYRTFKYSRFLNKFYFLDMVRMHHMTSLRFDYDRKLRASSFNRSESGKKAAQELKKIFNTEYNMTVEEILRIPDVHGGYKYCNVGGGGRSF